MNKQNEFKTYLLMILMFAFGFMTSGYYTYSNFFNQTVNVTKILDKK